MKSTSEQIRGKTVKLTMLSLLTALAIVLSVFEQLLPPLPMLPPGAKLGLSNVVTMYAASVLGIFPAVLIALLKSVFVGFTRGVTAFLMSASGSFLSTLVTGVLLARKKKLFSYIGVGVIGALVHNLAQLSVAMILTSPAVIVYLPVLLIFAGLTGVVTGLLLHCVMPAIEKLRIFRE